MHVRRLRESRQEMPLSALRSESIERAWELGVRFFDTAPLYGQGLAERRLGASAAEGFAVLDDPGYAWALRMGAWFDQAAAAAGTALEAAGGAGAGWSIPGCPCLSAKEQ